jgi:hypothetical protein
VLAETDYLCGVQYISITIQWLTKNFKMRSYVLSTQSLQGEHSADNIAAAMGETLRFESSAGKALFFIRLFDLAITM